MRKAFLLVVFALGLAASAAAVVRGRGPVRLKRFSLAGQLQALRFNRTAEPAREFTLSLRGEKALFEYQEGGAWWVLRCPLHAQLTLQMSEETHRSGCDVEPADEDADVRLYGLSTEDNPLLEAGIDPQPGESQNLTEQQVRNALFLPALQLDPAAPAGVMKPGKLSPCAPGQANCALSLSAGTLVYCGELRTCADGACFQGRATDIRPDELVTSLLYAQRNSKNPPISEAVTATTLARFLEAPPWGNVGPGSEETARDLRGFFDRHPRGICFHLRGLDVERPREAREAAQALAFQVFAPFDPTAADRATPWLAELYGAASDDGALSKLLPCDFDSGCKERRERIGEQLRSVLGKLQPPRTRSGGEEMTQVGSSGRFQLIHYDGYRTRIESKLEIAKSKTSSGKLVVNYQLIHPASLDEREEGCKGGVCLFSPVWQAAGKPDGGVESMVAILGGGGEPRCVRRLFNALAASGALPKLQQGAVAPLGEPGKCTRPTALWPSGGCDVPARPYGPDEGGACEPLRLGYRSQEPWGKLAEEIAAAAAQAGIAVRTDDTGSGDMLLTSEVASTRGARNAGRRSKFFGQEEHPSAATLEAEVAHGDAPVFALAFAHPHTVVMPQEQADAARSPWYLSRLLDTWSAR